ncbi:MAG: NAD-dependent epimerase/dehydratase family protein [Acidimicrobiia bacterium]|nr:NAD-dependent epimerase/dehydratase family protein [Acidimicrobiia bacterium]
MHDVLVTGAAGFIGSHVAGHLHTAGYHVLALDDLSGGFEDQIPDGVTFVRGSVTDSALVDRLFAANAFAWVFHLAAYAAEGLSPFIRRFNYDNNLLGSMVVLNAAINSRRVKCFVFTSSIAVYGHAPAPMREETIPIPADPYGISKYAVELDLAQAHEMFGLDYVIFRPHNVYGEHQHLGDPYRNVVGIFMRQLMQGEPLTIFGDGSQTRAFSHVDDVAPIIARCIERPDCYNTVYNIGGDQPCSVRDLAEAVGRALGATPEIRCLPPRPEVLHAFATHDRVRRVFGDMVLDVPLDEGLARMAAWARTAGVRPKSRFSQIEIPLGLPPIWTAPKG